ncbi:MAG: Arylsulfatase, partial [uncultured Rubrobacteraceae bacterium]
AGPSSPQRRGYRRGHLPPGPSGSLRQPVHTHAEPRRLRSSVGS